MWLEGITKADIMSLTAGHVEQHCTIHARFEQCLEKCWHCYRSEMKKSLTNCGIIFQENLENLSTLVLLDSFSSSHENSSQ